MSKLTIYGPTSPLFVFAKAKVAIDGQVIGKVGRKGVITYPISDVSVFSIKSSWGVPSDIGPMVVYPGDEIKIWLGWVPSGSTGELIVKCCDINGVVSEASFMDALILPTGRS
ncbi:hypothetical protein FACS1894125_3540 [Actinomycetota bacterium]|nr:hypothetical protein FACS1894125_3540 [Actinomycetota bacterium]